MLCPDTSCTQLLGKNVTDLAAWMSQADQTDPEILYWIPKYILMRGDVPLLAMGSMSPQFKALATSQDLIGWRDFTVGHILTHFYAIQSFHLAMSSSYLNGKDWIRQSLKKVKSTGQLTYKFTPFHAYLLLSNLFRVLHGLNLLLSNFFDFFMKSTLNYPNLRTYELLLFGKLVISYSRNCPHKISWTQK